MSKDNDFMEDDEFEDDLYEEVDEDVDEDEEEEEELEEPNERDDTSDLLDYDRDAVEGDFRINRYRLDEDQIVQAVLFRKYAHMFAEAKDIRDRAKEELSLVQATVEIEYRKNPPKDIKVTETSIKAMVAIDDDVVLAQEALFKAQRTVNDLEADVEAMQHRRSQLKNLTQLWIGGYYSTPDESKEDVSASMRSNLGKRGRDVVEENEEGEEE